MTESERGRPAFRERMVKWVEALLARVTLGAAFSALAMYLFVKVAEEMMEDETRRIDFAVLHYLKVHRTLFLFGLMKDISWFAGGHCLPYVVAAGVLALALAKRFWPEGFTLLLASVGGTGLIVGLKHFFHRPRPDVIFASLGYSFPSGHSFFALVIYGLLAYFMTESASLRRRMGVWTVATLAILLVGFSRMYLGEHFPSDVAAGYAVGLPWLLGCMALVNRWHPKNNRRS